jgi:CheY-like chemotaxis protein
VTTPARDAPPPRVVLVVDDHEPTRSVLAELLGGEPGVEVIGAASGLDVLGVIARTRPDAVLLDLDMPGMDGIEVAAWLRGDAITRDVPLVGMTALPRGAGMRREFASSSCLAVLDKPLDFDLVLTTLRQALGGASRPG